MLNKKSYVFIEFVSLFGLLPLLFLFKIIPLYGIVPVLWLVSLYVFVLLKIYEKKIIFKRLPKKQLQSVLIRFIVIAVLLVGFTFYYYEERLFHFVLESPKVYLMIMVLYPLLSVIPQELIFRRFFTFRYQKHFSYVGFVFYNALVFAFAHILFLNYIAVIFTFIGGILFMLTYLKKKSFSLVCVEHALYGNLLFTIGLGDFFYHNGNI